MKVAYKQTDKMQMIIEWWKIIEEKHYRRMEQKELRAKRAETKQERPTSKTTLKNKKPPII